MGAQASKPGGDNGSVKTGQDVTLSQSILNKLSPSSSSSSKPAPRQDIDTSSPSESTATSPSPQQPSAPSQPSHSITDSILPSSRQTHLDNSVRSAISSELSRLRKQEADVTAKIQAALKEENLAIEKKWSGGDNNSGRSAHALQKELDAVKEKINRHNESRKAVENTPGVKEAREKVVQCYKKDIKRTLECYEEVRGFVEAVELAEKNFIASLK